MESKDKSLLTTKRMEVLPFSKSALVAFGVSLLLAVTVVTVCMETIYIRQLQEREQQSLEMIRRLQEKLGERLDSLEKRLSSCPCGGEDKTPLRSFNEVYRKKRLANTVSGNEEESEHVRKFHHGIPSSDIALLYADPSALISTHNISRRRIENSKLKKNVCVVRTRPTDVRAKDIFCFPDNSTSHWKFQLYTRVSYPYFLKAPWMEGDEEFSVIQDGGTKLVVQKPGLFIVTAKIVFAGEGGTCFVFASDSLNNNERMLSSTTAMMKNVEGYYSCVTFQLTSLSAKDRVYMKVFPSSYFVIDKDSFYIAVIKLNDWGIDTEISNNLPS